MNGCICCTVRGDLVTTLKRLHAKGAKFDGIIIETTGLADPAPVAQTFCVDDYVKQRYTLDGICTVVDAKHILQHLEDKRLPKGAVNESAQLGIPLNPVDLAPAPRVSELEIPV